MRWFAFYDALQTLHRSWQSLAVYLDQQHAQKDPKAVALHKSITSAEFVATLYMMMDVIPILTRMNKVHNFDYILNGSDYILNDCFEDTL